MEMPKLNSGEELCHKCKGSGLQGKLEFCNICLGSGKLDWVENMTGKQLVTILNDADSISRIKEMYPKLVAEALLSVQPIESKGIVKCLKQMK